MAPSTDHTRSAAERLTSGAIEASWLLYALGALYLVGPLLGWLLAAMAAAQLYLGLSGKRVPAPILLWLGGMLAMLVILLAGHVLNDLGLDQTLKSATGWAKGWALLALFPFAGAILGIRPQVIYRAVCRLGLQTLLLLPLLVAAPYLHLPGEIYVSPLRILGGSGPEFFSVVLYTIDPEVGAPRWQFFAPWSPAAGMIAVVHILCALEERHPGWKAVGIAAGIAVALLSQSRLAFVALAVIWPLAHLVSRMRYPWFWRIAAVPALLAGWRASELAAMASQATERFNGARADSSRVRATLGRIAVERWRHEAPWFGHGVVERGPHLVEYMPIGSHHSWYGLLFVKGLCGVVALALPLAVGLIDAAASAVRGSASGRVAFAMLMVLLLYSFGENLEVLGYLVWPGLLLIGIGAAQQADATR